VKLLFAKQNSAFKTAFVYIITIKSSIIHTIYEIIKRTINKQNKLLQY